MTEIKAIETRYKGYRFRSRVEARWAIVFDALGIQWEYEIEGFKTPSGNYLPDFRLPQQRCWVEIKPSYLADDSKRSFLAGRAGTYFSGVEIESKCASLSSLTTDIEFTSAIIYGSPGDDSTFCSWFVNGKPAFRNVSVLWILNCLPMVRPPAKPCLGDRGISKKKFADAINIARSARFEHGETP
jgi:hypothetical protein